MESYTPWLVRTPVSVQINKLSRLDRQPGRELSRPPLKVIKKPPSTRASPNVWSYTPLLKISLELQICQIPLQRLKSSPARGLLASIFSDFGASAFPANRKERKLAHHASLQTQTPTFTNQFQILKKKKPWSWMRGFTGDSALPTRFLSYSKNLPNPPLLIIIIIIVVININFNKSLWGNIFVCSFKQLTSNSRFSLTIRTIFFLHCL